MIEDNATAPIQHVTSVLPAETGRKAYSDDGFFD